MSKTTDLHWAPDLDTAFEEAQATGHAVFLDLFNPD